MHRSVSIIGAGSWGLAIANLLSEKSKVTVFHYNESSIDYLKKNRLHPNLPKYKLSKKITFTVSKEISGDLCVIAIPVQYIRKTLSEFKIKNKNILILSKGVECETLMFPSEIIKNLLNLKNQNIAILSGPSHAELLSKKEPTAVVVSSTNKLLASSIQKTFSRNYFRIYINKDVIGVQLGGSIKNVISIASGISEGLGYKENTISAILTRSLKEINVLGKHLKIDQETIWGLSCIGDLMATSFSRYSRNRDFGVKLAKGSDGYEKIISSSVMTVEGVSTSKSIFDLSRKHKIKMPICDMVYKIIYKNKDPRTAIKELMKRPLKDEK